MNVDVQIDGTPYVSYPVKQLDECIQKGSFTLRDQAWHDQQYRIPVANHRWWVMLSHSNTDDFLPIATKDHLQATQSLLVKKRQQGMHEENFC